jgi:hypothetical protein
MFGKIDKMGFVYRSWMKNQAVLQLCSRAEGRGR